MHAFRLFFPSIRGKGKMNQQSYKLFMIEIELHATAKLGIMKTALKSANILKNSNETKIIIIK